MHSEHNDMDGIKPKLKNLLQPMQAKNVRRDSLGFLKVCRSKPTPNTLRYFSQQAF